MTLALAGLGAIALAAATLAVAPLVRRRRGPPPLSQILLAGSLGAMQRPRPFRRGAEP